jgi:hypothetical protein
VAAPTFGAEGADGCAPVTKAQEGQERGAPAEGTTSRAGGGADKASEEARRPRSRVAGSSPKAR